ncbi:MAG TPA: methyltransferase domain-containing protein [Syntrophomonadaceae bacterium]|nr:methyltransferase domain-containing protein [Syntrophomonadaceae bacterium]
MDMRKVNEKSPAFWGQCWQEGQRRSIHARKRRDLNQLDYWDGMAQFFVKAAQRPEGRGRVQKVMSWLQQEGVWKQGMEVLDIGSGVGNFAIPMAKRAARVMALEPAPAMLRAMQKLVEEEGLNNVDYLDKEWQDLDPKKEGLIGRFDLVFASLTPGIRDVETLEKMCQCSRGWCLLCDFAGMRWFPGHEELWRLIFNEEMPLPGHDIMYPLNYLYCSGYMPSFKVWIDVRDREMTVQEAVDSFEQYFWSYTELTPREKEIIRNHVEKNSPDGIYKEIYRIRLGMILWSVNDRME